MIKVICLLCEQETPSKRTEVFSSLIARNNKEALANLGQELGKHIMEKHREELKEIEASIPAWATFMVLRHFDSLDNGDTEHDIDGTKNVDIFEKEKEDMRDKLIEQVMRNCDEDEEDLEDDEVDENDVEFDDDEEEEEEDEN